MRRRSKRLIKAFAAIQWSPTRSMYMVSQQTQVDKFAKVFMGVK